MDYGQIWQTARRVWQAESRAIAGLEATVEEEVLARCVEVIAGCSGRIVTAGVGTSAVAARKIAHTLSCVERPAFFLSPGDAVHGALGSVQTKDVAILISKGGGTREIVDMIPAVKAKKACLIGVTEDAFSVLARESDIHMRVKVEREADPFDMLATSSTVAVIAVFDAICIAIMDQTGYSRAQFALIHPGGAVGKRLKQSR